MVDTTLPETIANDSTIRVFRILDNNNTVAYYVRQPHPADKAPVIERTNIVQKPQYFGEWEDKTEEYLKEHPNRSTRAGRGSATKQNRPGHVRTDEEIKRDELLKAQRLLAELMLNGGGQ